MHTMQLRDLAGEIQRQASAAHDLVVPTSRIRLTEPTPTISGEALLNDLLSRPLTSGMAVPRGIRLAVEGNGDFAVTDHAHRQIAQRVGIPAAYYDRLRKSSPALLAENVNHWWTAEPDRRMLRTLDGRVRAFVSDRFRALDNWMIANAALPVILGTTDVEILTCNLTERKLYIEVRLPKVSEAIRSQSAVGDVVQAGIRLTNSEIGVGAFAVQPMAWVLRCTNGLVVCEGFARRHVGKRIAGDGDDVVADFYGDDTVQADNQALLLKIRDEVKHAMDATSFRGHVERFQAAADQKLDPTKLNDAIAVVKTRYALTEMEGDGILGALVQGGDLSRWGLQNALTFQAHDKSASDYDRAIEYQEAGGDLATMDPAEWDALMAKTVGKS